MTITAARGTASSIWRPNTSSSPRSRNACSHATGLRRPNRSGNRPASGRSRASDSLEGAAGQLLSDRSRTRGAERWRSALASCLAREGRKSTPARALGATSACTAASQISRCRRAVPTSSERRNPKSQSALRAPQRGQPDGGFFDRFLHSPHSGPLCGRTDEGPDAVSWRRCDRNLDH